MTKGRLEAFSDGVIAIIITIMVLELEIPEHATWASFLHDSVPSLLTYLLSFVFIAIYWNNHHHLLHTCSRVTGGILWANTHLLFWLSLVPFATTWIERTGFAREPTAAYGLLLLLCAIAYTILQLTIMRSHGAESKLRQAVGSDLKGKISMGLYLTSIPVAWVSSGVAIAIFVGVALLWLVPDRRIERALAPAERP